MWEGRAARTSLGGVGGGGWGGGKKQAGVARMRGLGMRGLQTEHPLSGEAKCFQQRHSRLNADSSEAWRRSALAASLRRCISLSPTCSASGSLQSVGGMRGDE